jgi:hypothetical protein
MAFCDTVPDIGSESGEICKSTDFSDSIIVRNTVLLHCHEVENSSLILCGICSLNFANVVREFPVKTIRDSIDRIRNGHSDIIRFQKSRVKYLV